MIKAICDAKEWNEAQQGLPLPQQRSIPQNPLSTPEFIYKSDAFWKPELQVAGLAWSFYRSNKERISSHNNAIAYVVSPLMAEGLAICAAMEFAISVQMSSVVFESDSLQSVTAIAEGSSFTDFHGIISDIYLLSQSFVFVSFRFYRRESLCFEDSVAKKVLSDFVVYANTVPDPV